MKKMYLRWYKRIKNDTNDGAVGFESEVKIVIKSWGI